MKKVLIVSVYALLFLSVLVEGCNKEECHCEPVEVEEHRLISKEDSLMLDTVLFEILGSKPAIASDSIIRYSRKNVWDNTRSTIVLSKKQFGYTLKKSLFVNDRNFSDSLVHSENHTISNSQWQSIVKAIEDNCFFKQPSVYMDTQVLDASPLAMDVYFPKRSCGLDYFRLYRVYLREDDALLNIQRSLKETGVFRPYFNEQINPID